MVKSEQRSVTTVTDPYAATGGRIPHDSYFTPDPWVQTSINALAELGVLELPPGRTFDTMQILEPSAGGGAWVAALRKHFGPHTEIRAIELQEEFRPLLLAAGATKVYIGDTATLVRQAVRRYDLIAGNPPFALLQEHLEALLPLLRGGSAHGAYDNGGHLAFLVRSAVMASQERLPFWQKCFSGAFPGLRYRIPFASRPKFEVPPGWPQPVTKKGKPRGNDVHDYEIMVWQAGYHGLPRSTLPILPSGD